MKLVLVSVLIFTVCNIKAQKIKDYVELGQYNLAIESYSNLENPSISDQLFVANAYCSKGMYKLCKDNYNKALKNTKPDEYLTSKFQFAKLLQGQNSLIRADSLYTSLLKIMPEHAEILYQKGKIAKALNKPAYHQFYLDALLYDSKHIKAAHEASRYFMEVDNLKLAKTICEKTLDLVPNTPRLINLMAQIYYRENQWLKSLEYIETLEKLKADLPKFIYQIKANNYLKIKQPRNAVVAFKKAFILDDKDAELCLKIAETYLFLNEYNKARRYLMRYELLRDTSMWEFNYLLGKYYLEKQDYRMAFMQFQKSFDENINHEASQYFRAVAADNFMKDKSKALDYYTNYIETYEDEKNAIYIDVAVRRETELRRELFMKD